MKLRYFKDSNKEKIYTLKSLSPKGEETKDAHYKYLKIRDAPTSK
jgi:rRNA maturation protein Nop10